MPENRNTARALPDEWRERHGAEAARRMFHRMLLQDEAAALRALSDERLSFPSLYSLHPEITKSSLQSRLSARNQSALALCPRLLLHKKPDPFVPQPQDYPVLQWMLSTGHTETGLGEEYDRLMDMAALLLVKEYHDRDCLGQIAEMIFRRHRNGGYTYDAEWAFFESRDAECLAMAAGHLLSRDAQDVALARRLLRFIPCFDDPAEDPARQHRCVLQWLRDNRGYLRYTGESSQKGSNPRRFEVLLDAKYLQRPIVESESVEAMSYSKEPNLAAFSALEQKTKELLADYSQRLHQTGRAQWDVFMRSPLEEQLKTAARAVQRGVRA